ncbi:MAG: rRNA pseudouridine synthase, partial [Clostridia bacterium]|nr:rRNA pseudouridine synthase [Clostridia bacterium]
MSIQRLDKIISLNCSVSRRDARKLIKDGKVSVNGLPALRAETPVETQTDEIDVDGFDFTVKEHIYIMMNKPSGVISASDDKNKTTVVDLVPPELKRRSLFPAGRLDRDTTGLI